MAVVKDWALVAAEEIANEFYGQLWEPEHVDVEQAKAIILKHVPFEQDVAYMPVPRCDGCKHWGENEGGEGLGNGRCGYADYHPNKLRAEMYEAVLTAADFGCVQWEPK